MTLSFIIKFAKLVINKRGSRGSLNLSKTRSKNKQVCENAVTRLYGSCMLRVMGSCLGVIIVQFLSNNDLSLLSLMMASLVYEREISGNDTDFR